MTAEKDTEEPKATRREEQRKGVTAV